MTLLGIDLGGTNLRAGLVKNGQITRVQESALRSDGREDEILDQICKVVDNLLEGEVDGIGIGVPSVVDVDRGIVYDVVNIPSWKAVPVKEYFEQRYHTPVFVNNDANCFAVGEKYFGKGKLYQDLVGLTIGTGLGAGLVISGKLYSGRNCGAGEFGMIPWNDGVLENYCSGQFFRNTCGKSGKEIHREAMQGDAKAISAFEEFGRNLGKAIAVILLAVDPEIVILGGSVSNSFSLFQKTMWEALSSFPYPRTVERLRIEVSEIENVAILGAAALCHDALVRP